MCELGLVRLHQGCDSEAEPANVLPIVQVHYFIAASCGRWSALHAGRVHVRI